MSQFNQIDVTELPESQLKKSATWVKYHDAFGRCSKCHEHTDVLWPCCGVSTSFEGGTLNSDDLWNEIEQELMDYAEAQHEMNDEKEGDL